MIDDFGLDLLLQGVDVRLCQCDARQISRRLHEHCVDLITGLGTDIVLVELVVHGELLVKVLLDGLHVIQIYFVAKEDD